MSSLSILSLRFGSRDLHLTRAEYSARSALAQFVAVLRTHELELAAETPPNPLLPSVIDVAELFGEEFVGGDDGRGYRTRIHFDLRQTMYSLDNSSGEVARRGWGDSDGVPRVPPFSVDLVLSVENPVGPVVFRAVLERVWPFAVYTACGPIVLVGGAGDTHSHSGGTVPSKIRGPVYTQWSSAFDYSASYTQGYGRGRLSTPSELLANVEARGGLHPQQPPDGPLAIGALMGLIPPARPLDREDAGERVFYRYGPEALPYRLGEVEASWNFSCPPGGIADGGNRLEGDFVVNYGGEGELEPAVLPGTVRPNLFEGEILERPALSLDPLYYFREDREEALEVPFDSGGFERVQLPGLEPSLEEYIGELPPGWVVQADPGPTYLLEETLRLSPEENSTGGATSSHYRIDATVSNRRALYGESADGEERSLWVQENRAGLVLQDVVLHVAGDLDLGAGQLGGGVPIFGSGATIVVDGQLVFDGAEIDSGDHGFVIYARDIVLKGGGSFRGLLVASGSISVLGAGKEPLIVEGGLLCGGYGGVLLRGMEVRHQPRYLRSINGGGDLRVLAWSRLGAP